MNQGLIGWSSPQQGVSLPYIHIRDEKPSGTAGGAFNSGAWRTRTLNTVVSDTLRLASLDVATSQITLPAGTWYARATAPAAGAGQSQLRVQNITDGTTLLFGASIWGNSTNQMIAQANGRFTITSTKVLEVQHQCDFTVATQGMGLANSFNTGVFASIELWKEG